MHFRVTRRIQDLNKELKGKNKGETRSKTYKG